MNDRVFEALKKKKCSKNYNRRIKGYKNTLVNTILNMEFIKLAHELYKIRVLKVGEFILKSGEVSPYYIDLRLIPSYPILFQSIVSIYANLVNSLPYRPDAIAGLISAGIPFATGVSLQLGLPLLQIRSKGKDYGRKKLIEGHIKSGDKIVLIDDLISTGISKIDAIKEVRLNNLNVTDVIVLIDRRKKRVRNLVEGCSVIAAATIENILSELIQDEDLHLNSNETKSILTQIRKWN